MLYLSEVVVSEEQSVVSLKADDSEGTIAIEEAGVVR
jgi:hypothetical protein